MTLDCVLIQYTVIQIHEQNVQKENMEGSVVTMKLERN